MIVFTITDTMSRVLAKRWAHKAQTNRPGSGPWQATVAQRQ